MRARGGTFVIGIGGGSASGKTLLALALADAIGHERTCLIAEDDYYRCATTIAGFDPLTWNFDHPEAKDLDLLGAHLGDLKQGRSALKPRYDFTTHRRLSETERLDPAPFVILEGISHLASPAVRPLVDFAAFLEAPEAVRLARRLARDVRERGRRPEDVARQFAEQVRPMHERFIAGQAAGADHVAASDAPPATLARDVLEALRRRGARV